MEEFRLKWQTHVPILCQEFGELLTQEQHVDVTLACHNGKVKAHRLILSSSSPLLETVLASDLSPDATIILPDVDVAVLRTLIDYIYRGEIAVQDTELQSLVNAATLLQIRGIALASPQSQNELNASIQSTMPIGTSAVQNLNNYLSSPLPPSPSRAIMARKFIRTKRKMATSEKSMSPQKKQLLLNSQERHLFSDGNKIDTGIDGDKIADLSKVQRQDCEKEELDNSATEVQTNKSSTNNVIRDQSALSDEQCGEMPVDCTISDEAPETLADKKITDEDSQSGLSKPVKTKASSNEGTVPSDNMDTKCDGAPKSENGTAFADLTACVFCKRPFSCAEQLREHISSVHMSDRLEKQFKCDFCPAAFARSAHLKRHVRTHTGEKPYACTLCPRAFSRQDKLKCHMDRHCEGNARNSRQRNNNNNNNNNNDLTLSDIVSLGLTSHLTSPQILPSSDNHTLLQSTDSEHSLLQQQHTVPASTNPSLPYLQHILDDVQIVRDKKPASYYRQMKRQILAGSTRGPTGAVTASDSVPEQLLKTVRQLGECTIKLSATPVIE